MQSERTEAAQRSTLLHLAMEGVETLRKIGEFPDAPVGMTYFYDFLQKLSTNEAMLPRQRQLIATMCIQVPGELIYASGAHPVRLCSGAYAYDHIGADYMPAKSCPVVRATTGMLQINRQTWADKLAAVVVPTTCDQKKKMAEQMGESSYKMYSLEMPSSKESEAARFYWQESIKKFALDLQKITGRKISRPLLKKAIAQKSAASQLYRLLYELRKSVPPVISGTDVLLITNTFFMDDVDQWMQAVTRLIPELQERRRAEYCVGNRNSPRILLTGSPAIFPNLKVPVLIEQSGAVIVIDEMCSSSRLLYDTVSYDEESLNDMISAVADRYLKPCTCPCLSPNSDRIRKIMEMIKEFRVDGVVYQAFSGCLPYEMEQQQIARTLNCANIPMLYVETDYSPEDQGQLSTRIEAFIEAIKLRKRKKKSGRDSIAAKT